MRAGSPERFARASGAIFADRGPGRFSLPLVALVVGGCLLQRSLPFFHDDSFITLRYVANWLAGDGLGFNPGERVEGFTHPLWMLQIAALGALGCDLTLAPRLLGYGYFALLIAIWVPARAAALMLLPVVTLYGFVLWTGGGLEVAGFSFFLVAAAWQVATTRERVVRGEAATAPAILAGLALAAAALMRPEGAGVAVLAWFYVASARSLRASATLAGALALPVVAYLGFRLGYFGDYLPNSARAKIDGLPFVDQLGLALRYLVTVRGEWLPAFGLACCGLVLGRSPAAWALAALSLPVWGGILLGGGDHMPGARLTIPAVVLSLFAAGVALRERAASSSLPGWLAPVVVAVAVWQAIPMLVERPAPDLAATLGERVGRVFEEKFPSGTVVALATAGTTPFFAPSLTFIDMLGLNDPVIARSAPRLGQTRWQQIPGHRKGDGAYVLSRAPDVIVLGPSTGFHGRNFRNWFLGDFELLMSEAFYADYTPYRRQFLAPVQGKAGEYPYPLVVYLRNDSERVAAYRRAAKPLLHPFARPPKPERVSLESLEPVAEQPASVPISRPLRLLSQLFAADVGTVGADSRAPEVPLVDVPPN